MEGEVDGGGFSPLLYHSKLIMLLFDDVDDGVEDSSSALNSRSAHQRFHMNFVISLIYFNFEQLSTGEGKVKASLVTHPTHDAPKRNENKLRRGVIEMNCVIHPTHDV